MEALRVHFPTDLAKMILEKSHHSEHNDKLELCLESLRTKVFCGSYLQFCQTIRGSTPVEQDSQIKKQFPDIQDILTLLSKCSCCQIHNSFKPTSYQFGDVCDYRICCSPPYTKVKNACSCPCRHVARSLMRAHTYTDIEHIEDDRHLLHVRYLDLKQKQRKIKTKLESFQNKKQKLNHKISNHNVSEATYTKYYACIDKTLELQIQHDIYEVKIDEAKFHLHTHITDHPDVFTNADALFRSQNVNVE